MNSLTIRKASSFDVERLVELRLLLQKHSEKSNRLIWRVTREGKELLKQKVENDLKDSNVRTLLAEADGKIVGYVRGEVTSRVDYMPRTVGHVSLLYVRKQFRRKGVGRCLMTELCKFFNSNKTEHLTVRYVIGNSQAESFWRKLGFESIIMTSATHLKELNFKLNVKTN